MDRSVFIDFEVSGAGWARVKFVFGEKAFLCTGVSYLDDALGALVRLAVMVGSGAQEAFACFTGEPDGWRIEAVPVGSAVVQLTVYSTTDMVCTVGEQVFRFDCSILEFLRAVQAATIRAEPEFSNFSMGRFEFPRAALQALEAITHTLEEMGPRSPDKGYDEAILYAAILVAPVKAGSMTTPRDIANAQLAAYNARDLAGFMALFANDAWLEDMPTGQRRATGKATITDIYRARFCDNPRLHCVVHSTMDLGDFAIDHETVTGLSDGSEINCLAIYEVRDGLIQSVRFIRK